MRQDGDDKDDRARQVLALMRRLRSNRRGVYVALAIVVICATGIGLDFFWNQGAEVVVRWGPLIGLAAVAVAGLWFAVRLSRENEGLMSQIKELAKQLEVEGEPFQVDDDQQAALATTLKFNERLSLALVAVGFLGAISIAGTLLTSVDRLYENPLRALGVLAVALLCMGLAAWWAGNRKVLQQMQRLQDAEEEDRKGDKEEDGED